MVYKPRTITTNKPAIQLAKLMATKAHPGYFVMKGDEVGLPNDQLTDGGPPGALELSTDATGPPFGGAPGSTSLTGVLHA
jgi:hypothetical protein